MIQAVTRQRRRRLQDLGRSGERAYVRRSSRLGRPRLERTALIEAHGNACLAAAIPNPKWVAPPGTSLHRYGTELDLGPPGAYGWLAANARRFGFIKRYAWVQVLSTAQAGTTLLLCAGCIHAGHLRPGDSFRAGAVATRAEW